MLFSKKDRPAMPEMDAFTLSQQGGGSDESNARIAQLEAKVERLTALTESLWTILIAKSNLTDKHLMARLEKIMELRESRSAPRNSCTKCQQKNPMNKAACLYCGAPLPKPTETQESPFNF